MTAELQQGMNFTLPDWLPLGLDCVREHWKMPVFFHDELLITITQQTHSIQTAPWYIHHDYPQDLMLIGQQKLLR